MLPSLLVSAVVLSYYGFEAEVAYLMDNLCRNSKLYYKREKLTGFIDASPPRQLTWIVNFKQD